MDVTGAEALRRRIEKQAALQQGAGSKSGSPDEPDEPARGGAGKSSGRKGVPVRPLLSRWIEPTSLLPDEESLVPDAVFDDEPNGGGAGALNRRLAERRRQQTTGAPHATDATDADGEPNGGGAGVLNRRLAERRARHTTVAPRRTQDPDVDAVSGALERAGEPAATDEPGNDVEPAGIETEAHAAEAETMVIEAPPQQLETSEAEPSDSEAVRNEPPRPAVEPLPDLRVAQRRQLEADRRRQAALAAQAVPAAHHTRSTFPHVPTVAFSVALSVAAALVVAIAFASVNDGTPAAGTTVTVTRGPSTTSPSASTSSTGSPSTGSPSTGNPATRNPVTAGTAAQPAVVRLRALASYNPYGTGPEHSDLAPRATDRDPRTFWSTETYGVNSFQKPGTGLVFATAGVVSLAKLEVETDTPGFQAQIRVSESPDGRFVPDSRWQTVQETSVFDLKGKSGRYWVLWLRLPGHAGIAHVNELRALR